MMYEEGPGGLPLLQQQKNNGLQTNVKRTFLQTQTFAGGVAASGSGNIDYSGSTGQFKFPSGFASGMVNNVLSAQGTTKTLTAAQSDSIVLFDSGAGQTFTLPAPKPGLTFTFMQLATVSGGNSKVITDAGTTFIQGVITSAITNTANKQWVADGATHIAITMNGSTTGGVLGGFISMFCPSTSTPSWNVTGTIIGTGTLATPFTTS